MEDPKIGGESQQPVDPASFFTDEAISGTESQPSTEVEGTSSDGIEQPGTQTFNSEEWKFKAAGKEYIPKSKEELIKWASLGINYDAKARKLNEERAKFLTEKSAFSQQKQTPAEQPVQKEQKQASNPFLDPDVADLMQKYDEITQELRTIKETAENANQVTSNMTQTQYDSWLDESINAMKTELGETFTQEMEVELCQDLQEKLESIPDDRLKTKDGVLNFVRSVFFLEHPEGIDAVVQARVKSGLNQTKKNNGSKVITEGSATGSAKRSDMPTSWEDADERALRMFTDSKDFNEKT